MHLFRYIVTIAMLGFSTPAIAHPHVFIDAGMRLLVKDGKLEAVEVHWKWDEVYSDSWIKDFDLDRDQKFNATETKKFVSEATAGLERFAEFIFLHDVKGTRHEFGGVDNFRLGIEKGSVTYDFRAKLKKPIAISGTALTVGAYDETFFISVSFPKDAKIGIEGAAQCLARVIEDDQHLIYDGMVKPEVVELTCPDF
ncbi:DUF1007 family protein [Lacibacterium aquatile]|uniref:DUF1007 family protein n=1 Tax=Lacibacterium aquatile TaxID=1168082 RepID=A0ABW5DS54_9PROT